LAFRISEHRHQGPTKDKIVYSFTVDDPATFTSKFTGELAFTPVHANIYEYACHEGNYALPGVLAGARVEDGMRKNTAK